MFFEQDIEFFLFFPLVFTVSMWSCQLPILGCLQKRLFWIIPLSVIGTFGLGFFILPVIYRIVHRSKEITDKSIIGFVKDYSLSMGLKKIPNLYFIDTANPMAHSFTNFWPSIFISVGMFELLSSKELEAVILHELHHVMSRSSFHKFSTRFVRLVSPIARFTVFEGELNDEEHNADNFAIQMQNTYEHLLSAKRKVLDFC